jgi:hypothetical protein
MPRDYSTALEILKFRGFGQAPSPFLFAAIPWSSAESSPTLEAAQLFQSAWVGVFPCPMARSRSWPLRSRRFSPPPAVPGSPTA